MPNPPAVSLLPTGDLAVEVVRSESELQAARERAADRRALEQHLSEGFAGHESWTLPGFCAACERAVAFRGDWKHSTGKTINFRERLVCPGCKLNNRMRFMAHLLGAETRAAPPQAPTYLYEQVTPFFAWAQRALPGTVIGSEYLGPDAGSGRTVEGVRHEDALALSFGDASLGAVVSNDVFEHVPDIDRSLAECARVLRPGGRLYFSTPFHEAAQTVQRASMRDGEIVELLPAEYHENPLDPNGSLVFYDHGWDILERCRRAGFADAYLLGYWSLLYGYLGHGLQLIFVAEREPGYPHRPMAPVEVASIEELRELIGQELGPTDWVTIIQEDIDRFAEVSRDDQWIHVDVERAKTESPFGTTVAHGNLTLSLTDGFRRQLITQSGVKLGINYGFDKVRFPAPVPAGSRVRARAQLVSVDELGDGWWHVVTRFTIEVEGNDKPCCVADSVGRALVS